MKLLIILFMAISLSSCSSFMKGLYKDLDKTKKKRPRKKVDKFSFYRKKKRLSARRFNSRTSRNLRPKIRRIYRPKHSNRHRYRPDDLNDNSENNSLWGRIPENNYLFSINSKRKEGDILVINVLKNLKNEIGQELKKAFPKKKRKSDKGKKKDDTKKVAKGESEKSAPEKQEGGEKGGSDLASGKIHDRITGIVVEEISRNHLMIKGRKYLLYNKRKRLVEVEALVPRRDIKTDDTVDSDKILESNITVIR